MKDCRLARFLARLKIAVPAWQCKCAKCGTVTNSNTFNQAIVHSTHKKNCPFITEGIIVTFTAYFVYVFPRPGHKFRSAKKAEKDFGWERKPHLRYANATIQETLQD